MIKLISVENLGGNDWLGWIEEKGEYKRFVIENGKAAEFEFSIPKSEYDSYDHFVAVMGKFSPHTLFFPAPINIKELTDGELDNVTSI